MINLTIISLITGVLGSLTGIASLVWHIKDSKSKIIPKYHTGFINFPNNNLQHIFSMNFSNPTKHRIVVNSAGISFKDGNDLHFLGDDDGFPKVLLQGDTHTIYRDIDIIKEALDEHGPPNYIWVRDATSKKYKGSVRNFMSNVEAMHKTKHNN